MIRQGIRPYALAVLISFCMSSSAFCGVRQVPSEYPTVNSALSASTSGDTVLVAPGTYEDYEIRFFGPDEVASCAFLVGGVVLRSESGPEVTTIQMTGVSASWPHIVAAINLTEDVTVEGFTFVEDQPLHGNAYVVGSPKLTVQDCVFWEMAVGNEFAGGGIWSLQSDLEVSGCEFVNCLAGFAGAISVYDARVRIEDCYFEGCGDRAVGVMGEQGLNPEEVEIGDSRFVGNCSDGDGAAVWVSQVDGEVVVSSSVFDGNTAVYGGGAVRVSGTAITIEGSVFSNNWSTSTTHVGGAVKTYGNTLIENNTFFGNGQSLETWGGSAIAFKAGTSQLRNNVVAGSQGGAAIRVSSGSVTSSCNIFWENEGGIGDGYTPGPTDQEVNPLFCDPENGDLSLAENSPCLPPQSGACGLIGALGRGCGAVSVESRSWGRIKDLYR